MLEEKYVGVCALLSKLLPTTPHCCPPPPPPLSPPLPFYSYSGNRVDAENQEVRRLNERMMELQQARRDEVARLESTVEELQAKADGLKRVAAERENALAQASQERERVKGRGAQDLCCRK